MKKLLFFILIMNFSFSANAEDALLKESSPGVFEYVYNGEVIQRFQVSAGKESKRPMLYANCVVNKINEASDEEGRFFSSERVDVYCGRKPVTSVAGGSTPTEIDKANLFGHTVLEAADKGWVVFLPNNDSAVPGFAHLQSNGVLTLVDLRKYDILSDFIDSRPVNGNKISLNVYAMNPENHSNNERVQTILTINSDGTYEMSFNDQ